MLKKEFSAFDLITKATMGYSVTLYGLEIIVQNLFIDSGTIEINFTDKSKPAVVTVPSQFKKTPWVQFSGGVANYGIAGPTINQIAVWMSWNDIELRADGIHISTLNSFYDNGQQMYSIAQNAVFQLDIMELNKLSRIQLPPIDKGWSTINNDVEPICSLSPNPLNNQEAIADGKLPKIFTVLAAKAMNDFYLVFKLQQGQNGLLGFIEFIEWNEQKGGAPAVLKQFNCTKLLPEGLPYHYFVYWFDYFIAQNKNPLYHVHLCLPDFYHCTIFSNYTHHSSIVFNVGVEQTYGNNSLLPMYCNFGMVPVDKSFL